MTFGKRPVAPSEEALAEARQCPHCRGVGTVRARGQRKVCVACKGTGTKPDAAPDGSADSAVPDAPA